MEEWKEYTIGEVCETQTGPFGSQLHSEDYVKFGTPIVTVEHLGNKNFTTQNLPCISDKDKERLSKYILKEGDVVFSRVGSVDRCSYVSKLYNGWLFSGRCLRVRPKNLLNLDSLFLYYYFTNPKVKTFIRNIAVGATMPSINTKLLNEIPISLPSLPIQQKIAAILSSLDEKIETNRKINARLEELAQAIFKSWFIDFTPFSGKMPEDWEENSLIDMVEIVKGGDWGKEELMGSYKKRVLCIRGADLNSIKVGEKGCIPTRYILEKNFNQKYLSPHDIIVEISGGSPTQSTGRIAMISHSILDDNDNSIICTNFCKTLKIKNPYHFYFYYLWNYLYDKRIMFIYENGSNGIKNLNLTNLLERENHPIPSKTVVLDFCKMVEPIFIKIQNLGKESARLAELRDTLLPKLMSGEIKV